MSFGKQIAANSSAPNTGSGWSYGSARAESSTSVPTSNPVALAPSPQANIANSTVAPSTVPLTQYLQTTAEDSTITASSSSVNQPIPTSYLNAVGNVGTISDAVSQGSAGVADFGTGGLTEQEFGSAPYDELSAELQGIVQVSDGAGSASTVLGALGIALNTVNVATASSAPEFAAAVNAAVRNVIISGAGAEGALVGGEIGALAVGFEPITVPAGAVFGGLLAGAGAGSAYDQVWGAWVTQAATAFYNQQIGTGNSIFGNASSSAASTASSPLTSATISAGAPSASATSLFSTTPITAPTPATTPQPSPIATTAVNAPTSSGAGITVVNLSANTAQVTATQSAAAAAVNTGGIAIDGAQPGSLAAENLARLLAGEPLESS